MRVPVLLTELCHSPGDGMQHFPTVFGEAAACYARGQAYLLTFFFFLLNNNLSALMFSFWPDKYVKFQLMNLKSVKISWQVAVKLTLIHRG